MNKRAPIATEMGEEMRERHGLLIFVVFLSFCFGFFITCGILLEWFYGDRFVSVAVNAENWTNIVHNPNSTGITNTTLTQPSTPNGNAIASPFQVFITRENWIQVHFILPASIRFFFFHKIWKCFSSLMVWEMFEVCVCLLLAHFAYSQGSATIGVLIGWVQERPVDSLLGDVAIGMLGVIMMHMVITLDHRFSKIDGLVRKSVKKNVRTLAYFALSYVTFALCSLMSILVFKMDRPVVTPYFLNANLRSPEVYHFAVGHLYYPLFTIPLLVCIGNISEYAMDDCSAEDRSSFRKLMSWFIGFHIMSWLGSYFLLTVTYPWVSFVCALFLSIYMITYYRGHIWKHGRLVKLF